MTDVIVIEINDERSQGHGQNEASVKSNQPKSKCFVCGRKNHLSNDCAYKNCICYNCGIKGHLAPQCRDRKQHFLQESEKESNCSENRSEESIFNIRHLDVNNIDSSGNIKPFFVKLICEKIPLNFEADSGFAHAAISEKLYLKHFKKLKLFNNDLALRDYVGITFKPIGYLMLKIIFEGKDYILKTYIVKNGGPPLIGRNGLNILNLGICRLQNVLNYKSYNCKNLNSNFSMGDVGVDSSTKLAYLLEKYQEIFDSKLGTFNKFQISLNLKTEANPKFFKARPVPFALKPKIEEELERLINNGVLIKTEFSD